jgi:hypothetical protein
MESRPTDPRLWADRFDYPVYIEEGATRAGCLVCQPANCKAWLYLRRPNGEIIDPKAADVKFIDESEYKLMVVSQSGNASIAGQWFVRIERTVAPNPTPLRIVTFAKNDDLHTFLKITPNAQSQQYDLSVTIIYKIFPVCDLSPVMAQLSEYTDDGVLISTRFIELKQTGLSAPNFEDDADYNATIQVNPQSNLAIRVTLSNAGRATLFHPEPGGIFETRLPVFHRVLEGYIGRR